MELSVPQILYVVSVLAAGGYALIRSLRFLRDKRESRIQSVERRRRFEAVRTSTPLDDARKIAQERGIESIEEHFTVMRRVVVPLIIGVTAVLAAVPFLAHTSAATTSLFGAAVAVFLGMALRPFLENAFSGVVISSSRLVRIGDTVRVDNLYGTVEDITPTHTTVKLWDWRRYLVPNSRMLQSPFLNYSLFDTFQWAYVEFWVAPDADLDLVREIAVEAPKKSPSFSHSEDPRFWIIDIHKDSVCCWVAAWANTPSDAWALTHDVRTEILSQLRRRGIALCLQHHRLAPEAGAPGDRPS